MARYLEKRMAAHADGLIGRDEGGEVVPFEAAPVQPVDARLAWEEALCAISYYGPSAEVLALPAPPDWPQLVLAHEPVVALALCAGNFPQLVRNFQPLLQPASLAKTQGAVGRPTPVPALLDWAGQVAAQKKYPETLLALGALRLAKQFDRAAEILQGHAADVPAGWRDGWANEAAALAWHRGRWEEAYRQWQDQAKSVPVLFNRGMAALFVGQPAEARANLAEVVAQLPEAGAWHHLGRLYLTLAENRG
jgi:tetratricopeptide (TPR) repeat protein